MHLKTGLIFQVNRDVIPYDSFRIKFEFEFNSMPAGFRALLDNITIQDGLCLYIRKYAYGILTTAVV